MRTPHTLAMRLNALLKSESPESVHTRHGIYEALSALGEIHEPVVLVDDALRAWADDKLPRFQRVSFSIQLEKGDDAWTDVEMEHKLRVAFPGAICSVNVNEPFY